MTTFQFPEPTPEELQHEAEMILLAEFTGAKLGNYRQLQTIQNSSNESYWDWEEAPNSYLFENFADSAGNDVFYPHQMLFKEDWNWLMKVIDKIEEVEYPNYPQYHARVEIGSSSTQIDWGANTLGISGSFLSSVGNKLERTYKVCVKFLQWYKENNSNQEKK